MTLAGGLSMYNDVRSNQTDELVHKHAPLVKRIAQHLLARLPDSVQIEDLIQSGMIGLLEASRKYDVSRGASFETYAGIRIRGAMMDEIRKGDWVPRSVHRNSRKIADAIKRVEDRVGRDARDAEVAEEMGITLEEYYALSQDSLSGKLFSFDEVLESDEGSASMYDPDSGGLYDGVQKELFQQRLAEAIGGLPEKEKLILSLYYSEELNLKEIGQILSVSESRVSQIHSQAAHRLKARLTEWA
ncbi:MAG: RNA polymerase sigma factor FliA [Gammaproteobacteria bacterium]|nr:MAG: RNA polymerase sigma factor FliA [Pseudomonadota bacterium]PIE38089.1 MAG: RNA polymerase sigma factor FliA [Gammaproteobacteria bacterium]